MGDTSKSNSASKNNLNIPKKGKVKLGKIKPPSTKPPKK